MIQQLSAHSIYKCIQASPRIKEEQLQSTVIGLHKESLQNRYTAEPLHAKLLQSPT